MEFPIIKKAYRVFHKDDIHEINKPWTQVEVVYGKNANEAKARVQMEFNCPYTELRARRLKDSDIVETPDGTKIKSLAEYNKKWKEWRSKMINLVESSPNAMVYIWSGQWRSYWRPNCNGYTISKDHAGIYPIKEAWANVSHCGLEKQISFEIIQ